MSVLGYSALNKINKTLRKKFSDPDDVSIVSINASIDHEDILAGKEYVINLGQIPENSILMGSQINVSEIFTDGNNGYPFFSVGLETQEEITSDIPVDRDYRELIFDQLQLTDSGTTEYQGDVSGSVDKNLNDHINNLVARFQMMGVWSSGGDLNTARYGLGGCGTQNAGLSFGGNDGSFSVVTEEYNGTSWTGGGAINTGRSYIGGCGTQTAGLCFLGWVGFTSGQTEEYNGATWAVQVTVSRSRYGPGSAGTQTAAVAFGGYDTGNRHPYTDEYNGAAWSISNDLNFELEEPGGGGTQTAAFSAGGSDGSYLLSTEEYNGSNWSIGNNLNINRGLLAASGTQNSGLCFCGYNGSYLTSSEEYDGTSWSMSNDLSLGRLLLAGAGTQSSGFCIGGDTSGGKTVETEEYNSSNLANLTNGSLELFITYTYR